MRLLRFGVLFVSMSVVASAAEVAGVKLDERTKVGTSELVLNGAGLRKKVLFKVYVAGLYLTGKRDSPADVFALAGPKRASITSSPEEQQALKVRVEELAANLLALRQGERGDVITVDWLPNVGTVVVLNGAVKGEPIPGDDLYRALLRVWLGDRPTSAVLKKALLGHKD